MNRLKTVLLLTFLTAILLLTAGNTYSQNAGDIKCGFVKKQIEISKNQTAFNVFWIENTTSVPQTMQVNFSTPPDWVMFGEHTEYITLKPFEKKSIPVRVSPSPKAKGGIGFTINAAVLNSKGAIYDSQYCFLTLPVKYDMQGGFSSISYYLDHKYGQTNLKFNVKNASNSNVQTGVKLIMDESLRFVEYGTNRFETEVPLMPDTDTTFDLKVKYADYIESLDYYNRGVSAIITYNDTSLTKYSFIKFLNYRYDNYINDMDRPLSIEASALDVLSDNILWRLIIQGKLKFKHNRHLSYYYRSRTAKISNMPDFKNDEYFATYGSPKTEITVGNLRDNHELSLFGKGVKIKHIIGNSWILDLSGIDDIYTQNYSFSGKITKKFGYNEIFGTYTKMINDSSYNSYLSMFGAGTRFNTKFGNIFAEGHYSQYEAPEFKDKDGYKISFNYAKSFSQKVNFKLNTRTISPYFATYFHGRTENSANLDYRFTPKISTTLNYNYYKYQPATVFNNWDLAFNYHYHNFRWLYNHKISQEAMISGGPNVDYGSSNYYGGELADELKLASYKLEMAYNYFPNLTYLKSISINMQVGQTNPTAWDHRYHSLYDEQKPMLKFSSSVLGRNFGVFAMFYSGLYNMSTALTNFYSGTAGKYFYFMPFYKIVTYDKKFYYEVRFAYLNNIDLNNIRTSIIQEAGVNIGNGWSMRLMNNTNIQSISDNTGMNYKYTNNYMEFTVKKVFKWGQPGQKYHNLETIFYRDLNGNRRKDPNEPGVENVVVNIQNNSSRDTSYHYDGEMFGNIDLASNEKGYTIYKDIPAAKYYLSFDPKDGNTDRYSIMDTHMEVDLTENKQIYIPFTERNKVFGHVKFKLNKQSRFEDIRLDNIKITLKDMHGNAWFGITDKNGYYEVYAPVADFYTVSIDNIWSDYFDILHDNYMVKFNGYKMFEVNFDFEEKMRVIKFQDSDIDKESLTAFDEEFDNFKYEDVTQIKQTILKGTVSDEATMAPLKALITITELNDRNKEIAKQYSDEKNGSFHLMFINAKNYMFMVSCDGYWNFQEPINSQLTTFETISYEGLLLRRIHIGKPLDLKNLNFEFNSSELSPEAKAELDNLVILLTSNDKVKINIVGRYIHNEDSKIGLNRAESIANFLKQRSIKENRIEISSKPAEKDRAPYADIIVTSNN